MGAEMLSTLNFIVSLLEQFGLPQVWGCSPTLYGITISVTSRPETFELAQLSRPDLLDPSNQIYGLSLTVDYLKRLK